MSFSSEDKDLFLVGSENGGLYKCSMRSSLAHSKLETDLASPINFAFRPHHGPVYGISASPFHRNLFLSCGTDTTARLYSLLDVCRSQSSRLLLYYIIYIYCCYDVPSFLAVKVVRARNIVASVFRSI